MKIIQLTSGLFDIAFTCRIGQFVMIHFGGRHYFRFGKFEPDTPQEWYLAEERLTPERLLSDPQCHSVEAAPEIYPCRYCGEVPEWVSVSMGDWDGKLTHKCLARSWSLIGKKDECLRDWNEVHGSPPIAGWIYVKCDTCGDTWRETVRDIKADSSVKCMNGCEHGGNTHVWKRDQCFLPIDRNGDLRERVKERLTRGLGCCSG